MSAVSTSARNKKPDPLSKKTPTNPKYDHIKHTVDTGSSVTRYLDRIEEFKKNFKKRDDENFKRMKVTTFVQLILQVKDFERRETPCETDRSDVRLDTPDREVARIQGGERQQYRGSPDGDHERKESRSRLQEVIKGTGEIDIQSSRDPPSKPVVDNTCPYLLLDVRLLDEYNECHIASALSYPKAQLSRAMNYASKEMLAYRNQPGKIIVVYDDNEKIAPDVATWLVQREFDNVFLLSGGMRLAYKIFGNNIIRGTANTAMTDGKEITPKVPADHQDLSDEDLYYLEQKLDEALGDKRLGSRLSNASTASRRAGSQMSKASVPAGAVTGRKPFR